MHVIDAAHDAFVTREDSPVGAARRALFDLVARLEELAREGARSVTLATDEGSLGRVLVSDAGFTLASDPSSARSDAQTLVHALSEWSALGPSLRLTPSSSADDLAAAPGSPPSSAAELFANAGAASEPPRPGDRARQLYDDEARSPRAALLLRLRERTELLPYPVAARGLGALDLRALVELCHAAASLVRPPGWPSTTRSRTSWGVLETQARRFAVIPGDSHIAVLEADEQELTRLFQVALGEPERSGEGSTDER